jgi:hypothetical protein
MLLSPAHRWSSEGVKLTFSFWGINRRISTMLAHVSAQAAGASFSPLSFASARPCSAAALSISALISAPISVEPDLISVSETPVPSPAPVEAPLFAPVVTSSVPNNALLQFAMSTPKKKSRSKAPADAGQLSLFAVA